MATSGETKHGDRLLRQGEYNFNPFISAGSIGMGIDEFNGDNFDHGPLGFVGGGYLGQVQTNGRPMETTPVPPARKRHLCRSRDLLGLLPSSARRPSLARDAMVRLRQLDPAL